MDPPTSPSEDMSHLLIKPATAALDFDFDTPRDYLPDTNTDWVITIGFERSDSVSREEINEILDMTWVEEHGRPTLYGFSPHEKHLTFVNAADSPDLFTSLKIAWSLWDGIAGKPKEISSDDLGRWKQEVESRLSGIGDTTTQIDRDAIEALSSVATLPDLVAECDRDITLKLLAPDGQQFSGRDVWDVMLCLNLDYGDGDLFHWINNSGIGDDHFFTVETSTPPGYFDPWRMANGEGEVADLIFSFSIPRSADPAAISDSMADAIKYAQKRLGGEILDESGSPIDRAVMQTQVKIILRTLKNAGFQPGTSPTMRVF